jgi:hypothetical protein
VWWCWEVDKTSQIQRRPDTVLRAHRRDIWCYQMLGNDCISMRSTCPRAENSLDKIGRTTTPFVIGRTRLRWQSMHIDLNSSNQLIDIFLLFGAPHILQSDNGSEFKAQIIILAVENGLLVFWKGNIVDTSLIYVLSDFWGNLSTSITSIMHWWHIIRTSFI